MTGSNAAPRAANAQSQCRPFSPGVDGEHPALRVLTAAFPADPEFDSAVSRALLEGVAAGTQPETLRIYRPRRVLAFGPSDRVAPGYTAAREAAVERGYTPVERLSGGRAAVYHEDTVAFAWTVADPDARLGICSRFGALADIVADSLIALGVDARVGEIPGEYCPGRFSVNAGGRTKISGLGQRVVRGAAHLGGVTVVAGSQPIRDVLVPVYRALDLAWDPATVGSIEDERVGVAWEDAVAALRHAFADRYELYDDELPSGILDRARELAGRDAMAVVA